MFKNKEENINVNNYHGITVLPVVYKIIDSILKLRIRKKSYPIQCTLQRGFTEKLAPLNATFILEEARRESWDDNNPFIIVMLVAKSAFDVVVHKNMLRKLYHIGIDDNDWTIINSMYTNAKTSIKWKGYISESFNIEKGLCQSGILSADLCKIYVDQLLRTLKSSGLGVKIGDEECCATACADDITITATMK